MWRPLLIYLLSFAYPFHLFSQIIPKENDTLNYRLIGFSFPALKKAKSYTVEIASGNWNDDSTFSKNIVKTVAGKSNKLIGIVPSFGKSYTWRIVYQTHSILTPSALHHFTVAKIRFTDTADFRVTITQKAQKYQDAYFFMDGTRSLYDMDGNPLWFLPDMRGIIKGNSMVRDIKLTQQGTITFLCDGDAYEINYKGKILWKGPSVNKKSDTMRGFHHEFTRLSNGNYMMLSIEPMLKMKPQPQHRDSSGHIVRDTGRRLPKMRYGTIEEYDEDGNLVWKWNAADYFAKTDMSYYMTFNGFPERDYHLNSFFFDEKNKVIYVSFRNLGQILKLSYPSGEVLNAYGKLKNTEDSMQAHFFCGQHSCKVSEEGYLYCFNNRCSLNSVPSIVMMRQPASDTDTLAKIWEFPCPVDPSKATNVPETRAPPNRHFPAAFSAGGNVMELPDHSIFASTNTLFNKIFIVSLDKQILWSAEVEKWQSNKQSWLPFQQYRCTIIPDPHQLVNVIWNSAQ